MIKEVRRYMREVINNLLKDARRILHVIIFVSCVILLLEYIYNYPLFGFGGDIFQHLACIREISKGAIPPHNPITASNVPDVHYGPYLVVLGYIFAVTKVDPIILLYIAGLINLCLFIFFAFKFINEVLGERIAILSVISMLFIWGPWGDFAGVYKIFAAYDFFYPQGVAYTLLFAALFCLIKAKKDKRFIIFSIILSVILFTTHLLTGIFYLILIYLLVIADCYKTKKFDKSYHLFLIGLPVITFLISLLWPFYPVLDAFLVRTPHASVTLGGILSLNTSSPIIVPEKHSGNILYSLAHIFINKYRPFGVIHYPVVAGFACFGVIGLWNLIKENRLFLPLWFSFCFIMVVILAPFSERFFLFSLIPLHIGFGILLDKFFRTEKKKLLSYIVVGLLAISFLTTGFVEYSYSLSPIEDYNFIINNTEKDSVIMSDRHTSWKIPALTGRKVIFGHHGSGFPNNGSERLKAINTFYGHNTSNKERCEILKKYNVSYVVINNKIKPLKLPYSIKYQNDQFIVYDCKNISVCTKNNNC